MTIYERARDERGQVLAIVVGGFFALIAMVALVVDGGNAFAQQRIAQNSADASAEAGATVLAERLGGVARTDAEVRAAIDQLAASGGLVVGEAVYVDIAGEPIDSNGVAVTVSGGSPVVVGSLGAVAPPPNSAGVDVTGSRSFETFFARAIGLGQFSATTEATAITGYRSGECSAATGCVLLPVAIPINILTCDGQNDPQIQLPPTHWGKNIVYRIPLCKNGPGNVGWLDWTPPAGGTSELVDAIIPPPYSPDIDLPSWQFVTETGNINSASVESALRHWDGQPVLIPIFDSTCDDTPSGPGVADCPPGHTGGNGQNQWYHLPEVAAFQLCDPTVSGCAGFSHGAYVNGNNTAICEVGGNGATACLVGKFVDFITEGTVGNVGNSPNGPSAVIAVQLIR
jgi:hypothetical protein